MAKFRLNTRPPVHVGPNNEIYLDGEEYETEDPEEIEILRRSMSVSEVPEKPEKKASKKAVANEPDAQPSGSVR